MPDNDNDLPLCPNCLGNATAALGCPCPVCNVSPGLPQLPDDFEIDVEVFDRPPNGKPHH